MMVADPDRPEVSVEAKCHLCGAGECAELILSNCHGCERATCPACLRMVPLQDGGTFDVCRNCAPPQKAKRKLPGRGVRR